LPEGIDKEEVSRQYLLRELSPEAALRLEEEYFANDEVFEQIEIAEDELIDEYVKGELPQQRHKLFEDLLRNSPRIAQRVELAKLLAQGISRRGSEQIAVSSTADRVVHITSWKDLFWPVSVSQQITFAAAVLLLVVTGTGLFVSRLRLREASRQLSESQAELERKQQALIAENNQHAREAKQLTESLRAQEAENARLQTELERTLKNESQLGSIMPILLSIAGSRAEGTNKVVKLPAEPRIFELRMTLEEQNYERYAVTVKTADERVISGPHELKANGKLLKLRLTSTRFRPDDYIVTVSGITPSGKAQQVEDYTFRLVRGK